MQARNLIYILLLLNNGLLSQTIQGKVVDVTTLEPLIGATILSSIDGTITGESGSFEIKVNEQSDSISISYIGYESQILKTQNLSEAVLISLAISKNVLETAVITSSMIEQNLSESTVSLEVIKPSLIENTNSVSLDQSLNLIPGVEILDGQANIRGGSGYSYGAGSRVLLLIDNIPALQPDAGFPNWDDIALENIAQVEVVKGAASALYGSSALNGVINVRYGFPGSEPVTKASIQYTRFGEPKDPRLKWWDNAPFSLGVNVLHKQKFGKFDMVAGLQYFKLESFRQETFQERGRLIFNNRYRLNDRTTIGANITGNISKNESFIFWQNAVRGAYKPFSGTEIISANNRWIVDPYLTHYDKFGNKHRVQGRGFYIDNGTANGLDNSSRLIYGEYQFQKLLTKSKINITTGITATRTSIDAGLYGGAQYASVNSGAYFQIDKKLFSRLNISSGVRFEYNSLRNDAFEVIDGDFMENVEADYISESKPVFRFGINYQLAKASFLRASFGQGYRFPTIAEKFTTVGLAGFRVFTNPNLESETGWSSEVGIKQGLKFGDYYAFIDFAWFWSEYNNMMEFFLTGKSNLFGFQSTNIGDTRIRGLDLSMGGQIGTLGLPINILAGYTYLDPRYKDFNDKVSASSSVDYNVLKYRSLHSAKFDIETTAFNASLGINGRYVSHMLAIDEEFNLFIPGLRNFRSANNVGYFVFNARLSYKYKNYKLSLLGNNLLNESYTVRPALMEAPRNYSLRMDVEF